MCPIGVESQWFKMAEKTIYSTPEEWSHARSIMEERIKKGEPLPFKINRDNVIMSHSFLVAAGENGKPILGVVARSKNPKEGILGFGSFGVCKLVLWEDGQKNAIKIEPENEDINEILIMQKLGLIRVLFQREWEKRLHEHASMSRFPDKTWIGQESVSGKIYKSMPLIEGIDLKSFLSDNSINLSLVAQRQIAISLVKRLMEMHNNGIIHNDLHSNNVMIDAQLNAYLIDFGKSIDKSNKPTLAKEVYKRLGRKDTQAPEVVAFKNVLLEQYAKDPNILNSIVETPVSEASDVYALGNIFKQQFTLIELNQEVEELLIAMQETEPQKRLDLNEVLETLESPYFFAAVNEYDQNMKDIEVDLTASASTQKDYDEGIPEDVPEQIIDGYDSNIGESNLDDEIPKPSTNKKNALF
jgi:serine/threonine protein kinase